MAIFLETWISFVLASVNKEQVSSSQVNIKTQRAFTDNGINNLMGFRIETIN